VAQPIKVVVSGAAGRMGGAACEAIEWADGMELAGRADPALDTPVNVSDAIGAGVHAVVGSTGFDLDELRSTVEGAAGEAKCFVAPNFAIGAVLMMQLSAQVAPHMPECEIVELHHDRKKDAPSGTAKRTAELIREAGGNVHEPIHSIRLPGLVAHQEVTFGGEGQTLSIRHDSVDRHSFMPGVILAVRRVADLPERFVVGLENLL
jgi:4-hydroxy-tetrahydrodipicolinate reductase